MAKKPTQRGEGMPYCINPSAQAFDGQPQSCFDLINCYGTYEIQRTMDTDNAFPRIAQGEGRNDPFAVMGKDEIERLSEQS